MIDISDGLSSEILHICQASDKGCRIYYDKVPVHPETRRIAEEFGIDPLTAALNGGEDYELLFTIPVNQFEIIGNRQEITILGHIIKASEGTKLITREGEEITLRAQGWNSLE
jgi:thiamine-monophosphate kinase